MGDLISRADAIEAIQNAYCKPCKERGDDHNEVRCRACAFDDAIIQIDALPSAEAEWIPCSERLPQCGFGMHYLVTCKDGHGFKDDVYEAFYDKYGWHIGYNELDDDEIIAWMPLPKPLR